MEILRDKQECCGCNSCYNACPVHAIQMHSDRDGFLYPEIDEEKCIGCHKCRQVCPVIRKPKLNPLSEAYACYALNQAERMESSSGGVFAVLAKMVLQMQGVVCGAGFDEDLQVRHYFVEEPDKLIQMKGTKYVQSAIGNSFMRVREYLSDDRVVLFSGTPCQIAGLKAFLGREYEQLICIDLICHGVPSPKVFDRYLHEIAGESKIIKMSFRNKTKGISNAELEYSLESGEKIIEKYEESPYIKGFIQNMFTRPSCFQCKCKGVKRCSDITIGDFWGIDEFHPGFSDDFGVSAVIVHSEKGMEWFNRVKSELKVTKATPDEISCWNSSLNNSAKRNVGGNHFFQIWNQYTVSETIEILEADKTQTVKKREGKLRRLGGKVKGWLA